MIRLYRSSKGYNFDWNSLFASYKQYVSVSSNVLEIGASTLDRTIQLSKCCHVLTAVELSPDRILDNQGNIRNINGDWQNLSEFIEKSSIDIAVSSHVIEHVPDDLKAINELYKVLKPGGVALLNTPNRKRLARSIIEFFSKEREFPYWEHQREYVEEDICSLIDKSRFQDYKIIPLVLGLHGGPIFLYSDKVPDRFRKFANYWEIHLFKEQRGERKA